jgi:hypothetical protein
MVEAGKTRLTETILDEPVLADGPGNGTSPLKAPACQQLHLIFAIVISTDDPVPRRFANPPNCSLNPKLVCKKR